MAPPPESFTSHDTHITVLTGSDGQIDLWRDIQLVGPALLYADKVTLASPTAYLIRDLYRTPEPDIADMLLLVAMTPNSLTVPREKLLEVAKLYKGIKVFDSLPRNERRRRMTTEERKILRARQKDFEPHVDELRRVWSSESRPYIDAQYEISGAYQFDTAIDQGLLSIEQYDNASPGVNEIIDRQFELLKHTLASDASYPLLDSIMANITRLAIREEIVSVSSIAERRTYEATSAVTFMNSLPTFPRATIPELLDIRSELREYLANFRQAMYQMRETASISPFSDEIVPHLSEVYERQIVPALEDIKAALRKPGFLNSIRRELREDLLTYFSAAYAGGLVWVEGDLSNTYRNVLTGAAVVAMAGQAAMRISATENVKGRAMYFLYNAEAALAQGR